MVTSVLEALIQKYAHPMYDCTVESFPVGLCNTCKDSLYKCKRSEVDWNEVRPQDTWLQFKLENIKVPRINANSYECPCTLCNCARFNPIGVLGTKSVVNKPTVNVSGEKMECEVQPKVTECGPKYCTICLQIIGRGIRHGCNQRDVHLAKVGRLTCGRSSQRSTVTKRKRNLSELVGRESEETQEQIVSSAIQRIKESKGQSFRLKLPYGGGLAGMGTEISIGKKEEAPTPLPIEVFTEIKKHLISSRKKMERFCQIIRKYKVKMTPRVREKLQLQDHALDDMYETVRIQVKKTVSEEVPIDPTAKQKGRKSKKLTRTVKREVQEEKDLTILKKSKEFIDGLVEKRYIWPTDVKHRVSLDIGDNSFK